jgi:ParB family chromosome partitioning protein
MEDRFINNDNQPIERIPIGNILPNPYQPASRLQIDMITIQRFAESIEKNGLLQIPVCRRNYMKDRYEMGDGWLRLAGYRWLADHGHKEFENIPVIVRDLDEKEMADMVMEANTVRKDLNPIELGEFYKKYLEAFGITQAELAKEHNISQPEVANTMRLLELPEEVRRMIISQEISETHGRTLL